MARAIAVGALWGVFCGVANGWPIATTLAQMAVPWVWAAALVGYLAAASTRQAALLGAVTLLAANVAYFVVGGIARELAGLSAVGGIRFFVMWTTLGLIVGPIAGAVGAWLTAERTSLFAATALATISVAEPLALWAHIAHADARVAYVLVAAVGLVVALVRLQRGSGSRARTLGVVIGLTYPTAVALEVTLIALGQISAPLRLV